MRSFVKKKQKIGPWSGLRPEGLRPARRHRTYDTRGLRPRGLRPRSGFFFSHIDPSPATVKFRAKSVSGLYSPGLSPEAIVTAYSYTCKCRAELS